MLYDEATFLYDEATLLYDEATLLYDEATLLYGEDTWLGGALNRGLKRFFKYIGLHVILKLILGLKRTVLYGLDPWPTIHTILTSFFLATA